MQILKDQPVIKRHREPKTGLKFIVLLVPGSPKEDMIWTHKEPAFEKTPSKIRINYAQKLNRKAGASAGYKHLTFQERFLN